MSRILIVSNRVSSFQKGSNDTGGLAVAVKDMLNAAGGIWLGWSGKTATANTPSMQEQQNGKIRLITMDLTEEEIERYYHGYSNQVLWPLFHNRLDFMEYDPASRQAYHAVNEKFARLIHSLVQPGDIIWVHDYQLIPLGECLRRLGVTNPIGFFLHIPFPPEALLCSLPKHERLIETLSAYEVVGFQTEEDVAHFHAYLRRQQQGALLAKDWVQAYGKKFIAKAFPISIDSISMLREAERTVKSTRIQEFKERLGERKLIVGVDRMDYSKGLLRRAKACEYFFNTYPELHRTCQIIQIAPPTRCNVPIYHQLSLELEQLVASINGKFADLDWTPIRYIHKSYGRKLLAGMYRCAQVALVTPLKDGMNLVAKEYIAAQDAENPGVLILSRFAGAARELDSAVLVNPYDIEGVGEAIRAALAMPLEERRARYQSMIQRLKGYSIYDWHYDFLTTLKSACNKHEFSQIHNKIRERIA